MEKFKVLRPEYYKRFQCIGGNCKNTCCALWTIIVDKKTYDKYMAVPDDDMRAEFSKNIHPSKNKPSQLVCDLDENHMCRFLDERKLCRIQLKYGHDYLSNTCRSYPRIVSAIDSSIEYNISMSCEAAAKTALLDNDFMRYEEVFYNTDNSLSVAKALNTKNYVPSDNSGEIFRKLRSASVFILQFRPYRIWVRLVILGFFIKQADALLKDGKFDDISSFAEEFTKRVENGGYRDIADSIPGNVCIKTNFMLKLLDTGFFLEHPVTRVYFKKMLSGLGFESAQDANDVNVTYNNALNSYVLPLFNGQEYVFENLLINTVFVTGFPFSSDDKEKNTMFEYYVRLIIRYCLIKYILVGNAAFYRDDFNIDHAIECIAAISRPLEHRSQLINELSNLVASNNMATLGALSIIVKE